MTTRTIATRRRCRPRLKLLCTKDQQSHKPSWVSRDDAFKKGTTLKAPPSLVQRTGFSPREPCAAGLPLQNDAPNGENDVKDAAVIPPTNAGKGFRPEHPKPKLHAHGTTNRYQSHDSPSRATPPLRLHAPCRRNPTYALLAASSAEHGAATAPRRPARLRSRSPQAAAAASQPLLLPLRPRPRPHHARRRPKLSRGLPGGRLCRRTHTSLRLEGADPGRQCTDSSAESGHAASCARLPLAAPCAHPHAAAMRRPRATAPRTAWIAVHP